MKNLIERLRQYSESLVSYKLGADFADAVYSAADMLENHASDRADLSAEIEKLRKQLEQTKSELAAMRNELCYKCGKCREAHNGACDGCRWKKAALKGGDG